MKALILAAGYGTRLYPRTKNFPKALLEIDRKPIIQYIVEKLDLLPLSSIVVVTNDRFYKCFQAWKKTIKIKTEVEIVNDFTKNPEDRLGAVGDMNVVFSQEKYQDDFMVLGGDNFFGDELSQFLKFSKTKIPDTSIGVFDIHNKLEASHFGVVSLNPQKMVVGFQEKPEKPESTLIAMCLYYFPKENLHFVSDYLNDPVNSRDAAGSYINWLSNKTKVYGFEFKDFWVDIGNPQNYQKAQEIIKRR